MRNRLLLITLLALILRVGWGTIRFQQDPLNVNMGDYDLYADGAQHLMEQGDFTNSLFLVRPPLFSVVIAAFGNNPYPVLLFNAIVGALIAPLTYVLARLLGLNHALSLWAALIYALDPLVIIYGAALLDSVALGNFFAILMMICLLAAVQSENHGRALWFGAGAGLSLVLSAYTRPEIYLIWTGLAVWLLIAFRQRWRAIAVYVLVSVVGIGAWTLHNGQVFGNHSFSTVSAFTMAFYRAASVERIGSGDDIDTVYLNITRRVEARIGNDPDAADASTRWGYHAAPPEIESALVAESVAIFQTYPLAYLITFPVGFLRMYGLDPPFIRPGTQTMGDYLVFAWNWVFTTGAAIGVVMAWLRHRWLLFWALFLTAGYYTTGTLLVKNAAMVGRERAVLTSYMAIALVFACWVGYSKRRSEDA